MRQGELDARLETQGREVSTQITLELFATVRMSAFTLPNGELGKL